jgi:hypothetical protein
LVSTKGIEANLDKIKALVEMQEPVSVKDVQKLIGRMAALNRFIPRAAKRSLPFFQVLRSSKIFKEASTRIVKWVAKLSEYTKDFERRSAIKSQLLADFVVDWTSPTQNISEDIVTPWVVHCDGAWCDKGVSVVVIITSPLEL